MFNHRIPVVAGIACAILMAVGISATALPSKGVQRAKSPVHISALSAARHLTAKQRSELRRLRRTVSRTPHASIASTASTEKAVPLSLPEGLGDAWVTQAADGSVCTFIPDPDDGFGSSCATEDDLRSGGSITLLGGAGRLAWKAIVVTVTPDGAPPAVLKRADGAIRPLSASNFGTTLAAAGSTITAGQQSIRIPDATPRCTGANTKAAVGYTRCTL